MNYLIIKYLPYFRNYYQQVILYDDFDIIMVNKPPFMVVHPTKSHFDNTIANGITYYIKEKSEKVK